jgi:hypothetical protein
MMRYSSHFLFCVVLVLLAVSGCGLQLRDPVVKSVSPNTVYNGADSVVVIEGERFYPKLEVESRSGASAQLNEGYEAELIGPGEFESRVLLTGLTVLDYESLQAVVPQGLTVGSYALSVTGPGGGVSVLQDGVVVTDSLAERLEVTADDVLFEVFDTAWFTIELKDAAGNRVTDDFDVLVELEGEGEAPDVSFVPGGLVNQADVDNGIQGSLGIDGVASVGLIVGTPGLVTISVKPENSRSGVAAGDVMLSIEPGSQRTLDIILPNTDFEAIAGEPFMATLALYDQFGNPIENTSETVLLKNTCSNWVKAVSVLGETAVEVVLTKATGVPSCPFDSVTTISGPSGQSDTLSVLPAETANFSVVATPSQLRAGEMVNIFVASEDAYGNETSWSGLLTVEDAALGEEYVEAVCQLGQPIYCTTPVYSVSGSTSFTVLGDDGTEGTSNPVSVSYGDPSVLDVSVGTNVVAGQPFVVSVAVSDEWGNSIDASAFVFDDFAIRDPAAEISCGNMGVGAAGEATFDCSLFTVDGFTSVTATMSAFVIEGTSAEFAVVNGPLTTVDIVPADSTVVAGKFLSFSFAGFDEWGNPFTDGVKLVDVRDTGGTISLANVTLGAAGTVSADASFTTAGVTEVVVSQGGVDLGTSSGIAIEASTTASLLVTAEQGWAWVGEDLLVDVLAVDMFGNRAVDNSVVVLSSQGALGEDVETTLVNGLANAQFVWDGAVWPDQLSALSDAGAAGNSEAVYVVDDCAPSGPTAAISFNGSDDAVACYDETQGLALISASMGGSTVAAGNTRYALVDESGEVLDVTLNNPDLAVELDSTGIRSLWGLVSQGDGCGSVVEALAWVGLDDGEPVGPVEATVSSSTALNGVDVIDVSVGAVRACDGTKAAGGSLRLRTDRGDLVGLTATGSGYVVTLNSQGKASFQWSALASNVSGPGELLLWADSEASYGLVEVEFEGDTRLPILWSQDPSGQEDGTIEEVNLVFSEALDPTTVSTSNFSINGADAFDVHFDGESLVTIELESPVVGSLSGWEVGVSKEVRDLAGNRLAGSWSNAAESYLGYFGDYIPSLDPVDLCEVDTTLFRPDGDDGVGEEADSVTLHVESVSAPTWWVITVTDSDGVEIEREFIGASLNAADWVWRGRASNDVVTRGGVYQIQAQAMDGFGNLSSPCTAQVEVAHRFELLE